MVPILVAACLDRRQREHPTVVLAGNRSKLMLLVNHSREQFLSIVSKISVTTLSIKQQIQGLQALASGTPYLKKTVIYYMYQLYTVYVIFCVITNLYSVLA